MNCLSIVFCGNHETLGTDHEARDAYVSSVLQLAPADFRIDENREFRHWNGGSGYGNGFAYVRLTGYGPVKDIDDCRKALGFMLSGGGPDPTTRVSPPDEWPSSEDVAAAFELLDRIREVPLKKYAIIGRDDAVCGGWATEVIDGGDRSCNRFDTREAAEAALPELADLQLVTDDDIDAHYKIIIVDGN